MIRFPENQIQSIAQRYEYARKEEVLLRLKSTVRQRGCLTERHLQQVARWKAPRSAGHVDRNQKGFVEEITSIALKTENERTRIEVLTLLDGVMWPTASVILHLFHEEPYPILDFRALWSAASQILPTTEMKNS